MKVILVLSVVLALAYGGVVPAEESPVFGYISRVAIPLAEKIRQQEELSMDSGSRIIGGQATALGQIPYQCGLISDIIGVTNGNGVCGGSLVSHKTVLTAAHCWFDGLNMGWRFTVVLGTQTIFIGGGLRVQSTDVVMHPEWSPTLVRNDIAAIHLPTSVEFTDTISPVAIPFDYEHETFAGEVGVASGYGLKADGGSLPNDQFLSHVELEIIPHGNCFLAYPLFLRDSNICTRGTGGVGTCQGDSGGPLTVIRNGVPHLAGVVSFGSPLGCESFMPAAYARVTSFLDFIRENL